jgi:Mor family transcriptional regulator
MHIGLNVKYPSVLSDFYEIFSTDFSRNVQKSNFIEIRPVGADFVSCGQRDRRTDRHDEANSLFFRDLAKSPKNAVLIQTTQMATKNGVSFYLL